MKGANNMRADFDSSCAALKGGNDHYQSGFEEATE